LPQDRPGLPPSAKPSREQDLDFLKGIAIVLVVLGHHVQGVTADFGHYWPFRLVYSFHMPMFMFVAGMTMSLGLRATLNSPRQVLAYVSKRAFRLLVPFVAWGVILFELSDRSESLLAWLALIFQAPDNALWFLLVLFEISIVLALAACLAQTALRALNASADPAGRDIALIGCLALACLLFWPIRYIVPALGMATFYIKYVCLGAIYKLVLPRGLPAAGTAMAGIVFAALWPFWVWNGPPALDWHPAFIDERIVAATFDFAVALGGTLVVVEGCRFVSRQAPAWIVRPVAFCGIRTLDIYALHYQFIGYAPWIVAPIALSLLASFVLRQIPFAALVLFGDTQARPMWWPAIAAVAGGPSLARKRRTDNP
jgi:fucose 4-O-acetylase-like acetyltransferase